MGSSSTGCPSTQSFIAFLVNQGDFPLLGVVGAVERVYILQNKEHPYVLAKKLYVGYHRVPLCNQKGLVWVSTVRFDIRAWWNSSRMVLNSLCNMVQKLMGDPAILQMNIPQCWRQGNSMLFIWSELILTFSKWTPHFPNLVSSGVGRSPLRMLVLLQWCASILLLAFISGFTS